MEDAKKDQPDQAAGQATATEPRPQAGDPGLPPSRPHNDMTPREPVGHEAVAEQPEGGPDKPAFQPVELMILFDRTSGVIRVSAPEDKVLALGMLECAKDVINKREAKPATAKSRIIPGRMVGRRPMPSA